MDKVRADTTVVPANVAYPTDSGLLARAIGTIVPQRGANQSRRRRRPAPRSRDRRRAAGRRARSIAAQAEAARRSKAQAQAAVRRITGELAGIDRAAVRRGDRGGAQRPPRAAHATGRPARAGCIARSTSLTRSWHAAGRVIAQTRTRLAGVTPDVGDPAGEPARPRRPPDRARAGSASRSSSATRRRSSTTPTGSCSTTPSRGATRPTRRCWPRRSRASPRRAGRTPGAVTADRGYGEAAVDDELHDLGVSVAIPARANHGRPAAQLERGRAFRDWSNGAPAAKAASATSNTATAGTAPARRLTRRPNLVRPRRPRPQPRQDRHPRRINHHHRHRQRRPTKQTRLTKHPSSVFQVEVAKGETQVSN